MLKNELSKKILDAYLYYDIEEGNFYWKSIKANKHRQGLKAGGSDGHGYRSIQLFGHNYQVHRLVFLHMKGEFPSGPLDHINHDRLDNKWENIRVTTTAGNNKNASLQRRNNSGLSGVRWRNDISVWVAYVRHSTKLIHLYHGDDYFEACCARLSANIKFNFHANHGS